MTSDLMPILGYDAIEFYVGNARQAAHYYRTAFGFDVVAYSGPEHGVRDRCSYVLEQNGVRFIMTAGLTADSPIVQHHAHHGDGVRDVAFAVPDAEDAFRVAVERGAEPHREPYVVEDEHGKIVMAAIRAYGETIHSFVDRSNYFGVYAPGYKPTSHQRPADPMGLQYVDHVVCNVDLGDMDKWAAYYANIMGFTQLHHFDDEQISTEYTALMSKVLWDGTGRIKLPINEPADGKKKSQIEEYLDFYGSAGVQHMALATDDIVATVRQMRGAGVRFLTTPTSYYDDLRTRLDWSTIDADVDQLAELGILADQDDEGYLLQIFTKSVQDRPTVFYEIIERHGSLGFGIGNFQALFEAIERDQALPAGISEYDGIVTASYSGAAPPTLHGMTSTPPDWDEPGFVPYEHETVGSDEMVARAKAIFEEARGRRSVRHFSDRAVPRQAIEYAIRVAATAPSGAHRQPWTFVLVGDPEVKRRIREAAETEERQNYVGGRMNEEWQTALRPLGTDWRKPFLETVPWIVVVFEERFGRNADGSKQHNYYVKESVGIACGMFISALHRMGLATLTHTPSPMRFLTDLLQRPDNERPFILFPVGYPADDVVVPNLTRKALDEVLVEITGDDLPNAESG